MDEKNKYEARFVDLPPEIVLVTRDADYVATPTLRFEPITGGVHVTNVRLERISKNGEENE